MSAVPVQLNKEFFFPVFQQQIDAGVEELELHVSHSSFGHSYPTCRRKFEFGKLYLHSRDDDNEEEGNLAGEVGHALHVGHQVYMREKNKELAFAEMMMRYPIKLNDNPMDYRSVEACYGTLNAMMNVRQMDGLQIAKVKCLDGETRFATEVPFEIRIGGYFLDYNGRKIRVIYSGFIDLVVFALATDEYSVIDIKTTRNNVKDKTALYQNDEQALPYGLIVSHLVGQDIKEMDVHYLSAYIDALEPEVRLYTFRKTNKDLRDWARTLLFRLKELNEFMNLHWFPRTGSACMNFKKNCRYFDACSYRTPEAIMHFMTTQGKLDTLRRTEPWIKIDLEIAA